MWWQLLLEEFGHKLMHIKGVKNIVTDALSHWETSEVEFSAEAFTGELANEEEEFPEGCQLSYKELACHLKKIKCCRIMSSGHSQNFTLRSHTSHQMTRVHSSLRAMKFMLLSFYNTTVPNGTT